MALLVQRAAQLDPNDPEVRMGAAMTQATDGRELEAAAEKMTAMTKEAALQDSKDIWFTLGFACQQGKDLPGAEQAYRRARADR